MNITTVLFDLDGTLLPMDQDLFVQAYFGGLVKKAAHQGYEGRKLIESLWQCIDAMVRNTGEASNETVFWEVFSRIHGPDARKDEGVFADFYRHEFQQVQAACGFQPLAKPLIEQLKAQGKRLVLATNPLFPSIATESRIRWAGLAPEDFELYTTYENSFHCKPSLDYYRDILHKLQLDPRECLMVGNDVEEDLIAAQLGMQVFLITDCLISRRDTDLSAFPHGSFQQLFEYLSN